MSLIPEERDLLNALDNISPIAAQEHMFAYQCDQEKSTPATRKALRHAWKKLAAMTKLASLLREEE